MLKQQARFVITAIAVILGTMAITFAQDKPDALKTSESSIGFLPQLPDFEPTQICYEKNTKCIPWSVFKATFADYKDGDPSPIHALRQQLIDGNAQIADLLQRERSCLGQLGPAQAAQHQQMLRQDQDKLSKDIEAAAPAGKVWDSEKRKYIPKPVEPTPATPPTKGGGRGGL